MDAICAHGIEAPELCCSICKHGVEMPKPPRITEEWYGPPPPPADMEAVITERVCKGEICPRCRTEIVPAGYKADEHHVPIGCKCSLRNRYYGSKRRIFDVDDDDPSMGFRVIGERSVIDDATTFLMDEEVLAELGPKAAAGIAFSVQRRAASRAGLTEFESRVERSRILQDFQVDPKWRAPRNEHPTHLPV